MLPACLPVSLPIGEPRETVLIDDLAVSADQGKNYSSDRRQEESGGYRRLSWDKWSMDSRVSLPGVQPGEKSSSKGLVRLARCARLVPCGRVCPRNEPRH